VKDDLEAVQADGRHSYQGRAIALEMSRHGRGPDLVRGGFSGRDPVPSLPGSISVYHR
jgi:hypothetical protein